jgi:hypothetical protein
MHLALNIGMLEKDEAIQPIVKGIAEARAKHDKYTAQVKLKITWSLTSSDLHSIRTGFEVLPNRR